MYLPTEDSTEYEYSGNFLDRFVISEYNKFYLFWRGLYIASCLTSSYFYAFIAAFGKPEMGSFLEIVDDIYEVIFIISFILCFLVDYKEDGASVPVR